MSETANRTTIIIFPSHPLAEDYINGDFSETARDGLASNFHAEVNTPTLDADFISKMTPSIKVLPNTTKEILQTAFSDARDQTLLTINIKTERKGTIISLFEGNINEATVVALDHD